MLQVRPADPMLVTDVVPNPEYVIGYGNDRNIQVVRTLRNDPIGQLWVRKQLSEAQFKAARMWQRDDEMAGPKIKSPGNIEEPVDGGGFRITAPPERLEDWAMPPEMKRRMDAHKRLIRYASLLGVRQHYLLTLVLHDGHSLWGATMKLFPGDNSARRRRFTGDWLREVLTVLAKEMRLA